MTVKKKNTYLITMIYLLFFHILSKNKLLEKLNKHDPIYYLLKSKCNRYKHVKNRFSILLLSKFEKLKIDTFILKNVIFI